MSSKSRSRSRSPRQDKVQKSRSRSPINAARRKPSRVYSKRVILINLPFECKWQQVKELFKDKLGFSGFLELFEQNGRPSGQGVMEFKTFEGAEQAIELMNGIEIDGRKLIVREETPRDRDKFDSMRAGAGGADKNNAAHAAMNMITPQMLNQLGIEGPVSNSIFVSNLDYKVTWQKLKDVFKLSGKVLNVEMKTDLDGKSKGIALVKFETPFEAVQAISMFNNQMLFERPMKIRMDKEVQPGMMAGSGGRLPEGLRGVGMGLGVGGAPARTLSDFAMASAGMAAPRSEPHGFGMRNSGFGSGDHMGMGGLSNAYPESRGGGGGGLYHNGPGRNNAGGSDSVLVKNLPFTYTWQDLKRSFREAGDVRFTEIMKNPQNKSRGVGIVRFSNPADARKAITLMDGARFDGRAIRVEFE